MPTESTIRDRMKELERRCPGTEFLWEGEDKAKVELRFYAPTQHGHQALFKVDLLALGLSAEEWLDAELANWPAATPEDDAHYGVICRFHGKVQIGYNNYLAQLCFPDEPWHCPICGSEADFDDNRLEAGQQREPA